MSRQNIAVHFLFSVQYNLIQSKIRFFSVFLSSLAEWAQKFKNERIFLRLKFSLPICLKWGAVEKNQATSQRGAEQFWWLKLFGLENKTL